MYQIKKSKFDTLANVSNPNVGLILKDIESLNRNSKYRNSKLNSRNLTSNFFEKNSNF